MYNLITNLEGDISLTGNLNGVISHIGISVSNKDYIEFYIWNKLTSDPLTIPNDWPIVELNVDDKLAFIEVFINNNPEVSEVDLLLLAVYKEELLVMKASPELLINPIWPTAPSCLG